MNRVPVNAPLRQGFRIVACERTDEFLITRSCYLEIPEYLNALPDKFKNYSHTVPSKGVCHDADTIIANYQNDCSYTIDGYRYWDTDIDINSLEEG